MTGRPLDPAPARPRAASLSCPSCGAGIAPRAQGWAVTIVCDSCGAVLDATDPNLHILQRQSNAIDSRPRIPLGTRGTWHGAPWEVIGFQVVTISVEGVDYSWSEYVAFNPYRGFLYLSEYQGHWNIIEKLHRTPLEREGARKPTATLDGRTYTHFQTATARTALALGEFPWELRVGDAVIARDFVDPPYMLSAEASEGDRVVARGHAPPSDVIAKMFNLKESLLKPIGVFSNQPNPYIESSRSVAKRMWAFVLVLGIMLVANIAVSSGDVVFTNRYTFRPTLPDGVERVPGLMDRAVSADSGICHAGVHADGTTVERRGGAERKPR